jgi:hypothetical protein
MKSRPILYLFAALFIGISGLTSCKDIIEPSISKYQVFPQAPTDQYQSTSYTVNFWWNDVADALTYHLQVVTPNFDAPGSLVLDTVIKKNTFSFNLSPGNYQWRVMALNGSSQTPYAAARSFTVVSSSIKQQTLQISAPANNLITAQSAIVFEWGSLYGATKYHIEIDTNNFVNENAVVSNQTIPGQQFSFTFPKDQVYQWRVRAENDTAQSLWTPVRLVTYDHTPPAQVSLTSPVNNQTLSLPAVLQWSTVATANRYKVYVYKSDSTSLYNNNFPVTVTGTSYSFNSGNSGDRIYWKVSALDAAGNEGTASELRSFAIQ